MANPSVAEWLDFMADTVIVNAFIGRDVASRPTYSPTATSYPAYIEMKNHLIVDSRGREILAKGRVFMGTTANIGIEDKLTLPESFVPRNPPILAVNIVSDEGGAHHITLEIG